MNQEIPMLRPFRPTRLALVAVVAATLASGCSWFRKDDGVYSQPPESRPLEVPPDLDRPRTDGATSATASATASQMASAAPVAAPAGDANMAIGFTVQGTREDVFAKVGDALAGIDGLTIASRAELLGAYDVNYQEQNFLVRVTAVEAGAYVSAVDPRGLPAAGAGPAAVIAALKAALGG
jgi:uncharacterized lipoprotein